MNRTILRTGAAGLLLAAVLAAHAEVKPLAHYNLRGIAGIRDTVAPVIWRSVAPGGPELVRRGDPRIMPSAPQAGSSYRRPTKSHCRFSPPPTSRPHSSGWRTAWLAARSSSAPIWPVSACAVRTRIWSAQRGGPRRITHLEDHRARPTAGEVGDCETPPAGQGRVACGRSHASGVWQAKLPAATEDFEYSIELQSAAANTHRWPTTAPAMNQTVVVN